MAEEEYSAPLLQVKFVTRLEEFSIANTPFYIPADSGVDRLNELVNGILPDGVAVPFDFLIGDELLRTPLSEFLSERGLSVESQLEVEFVRRAPPPEAQSAHLHDDWVSCCRARRDVVLAGSYDNALSLWSTGVGSAAALSKADAHSAPVKCCAWIDDDLCVSGSHDQTLVMWSTTGNELSAVAVCKGHSGSVDSVAVSPACDRFITGSWDGQMKLWAVEDGESQPREKKRRAPNKLPTRVPQLTLAAHKEGVSGLVWLSEHEVVSGSWDHTIQLWDINTAKSVSTLHANKVILDIAYSALSKMLLSASADQFVRLYDPRTAEGALVKGAYISHRGWVSAVAWSPHSENLFVSACYDNEAKMWDTRSLKVPLYNMLGHEEKILAADWSVASHVVTGSADNSLKLFRTGAD